VADGGRTLTVIDWPAWERALLAGIADLLPEARLRPAGDSDGEATRLASIPAALDPGVWTPPPLGAATRWTLTGAWVAGLGGLAAALWALVAAARLAERRAAFVSAVTHELRTPLTALRLHGDLLADARIADDPARRAAPVAAVRDGALRLAHLIDNVLDYARLERRRPPAPQAVPVHELLPSVAERLPELAIAPLPAGAAVRCDRQAVERILANLADNAVKYGRPPYAFAVERHGRRLHLVLADRGPGLAADARARLFTPFARSAEAAAGDAPGVGLGLALCRRLARAQGGDLRLEEQPGGGVRAVLVLRRADC
jgi:signal transduction histidine kinase